MTKLPEGFTHELQQHLPHTRRALPGEPGAGVPVLNFDDFCCGAHGFAALIETEIESDDSKLKTVDDNNHGSDDASKSGTRRKRYTLFDTGPDSLSLVRNIRALQVPITKIDRVVTSHWHSDHTGGLLSFLDLRRKCVVEGITTPPPTSGPGRVSFECSLQESHNPISTSQSCGSDSSVGACTVDVHPSRPILRGIAPPAMGGSVLCALPPDPTFEAINVAGGIIEKHDEGHLVADGTVWISGEIPRVTEWEEGLPGSVRWVERDSHIDSSLKDEGASVGDIKREEGSTGDVTAGRWVPEPHIMDERYAVVDVIGKGLVVFSSCSHAGIVNVIKDAIRTFNRPIYMIVGGLHLASSDLYPRIEPTVSFLSSTLRPSPTYILPMHCTGWKAKIALEEALGDGVVPAGVGHRVVINGVAEKEEGGGRLWVSC